MHVFGCLCFTTNYSVNKGKFESQASLGVFIGYLYRQKGYKIFDLQSHQIYVSRDVIFKENIFPYITSTVTSVDHSGSGISVHVSICYPSSGPATTLSFTNGNSSFSGSVSVHDN